MSVLTEGFFNFQHNIFIGKWISSSGAEGHFTSFYLGVVQQWPDEEVPETAPDKAHVYNLAEAESVVQSPAPPASTYTTDAYNPGMVQPSAPPATTYTTTTANNESTGAAPSMFDQMLGGMK